MDATTKLKQIVFIGLACLTCVAVVIFARTGDDEAVGSVSRIRDKNASETISVQDSVNPPENEFSFASRIPAVDDTTQAYPVQLASYDSIPWISDPVTPNRISSPTEKPADSEPNRTQIASPPGEHVLFPSGREQVDSEDLPSIWTPPKTTPIQISEPAQQNAKVFSLNDFQPKGRRIEGLAYGTKSNSKATIASQFDTNKISINPDYSTEVLPNSSGPDQKSPIPGISKKRIKGIYPLGLSQNEKMEAKASGQRLDSSRGNSQLAVVSNPFYQSNSQSNRSISKVEKPNNQPASPALTSWNDLEVATNKHSTKASVANEVTLGTSASGVVKDLGEFDQSVPIKNRELATLEQPQPNSRLHTPKRSLANDSVVADGNTVAPKTSTVTNPDPNATPAVLKPRPVTQSESNDQLPAVLRGAGDYVLAVEPKVGEHWYDQRPVTDPRAFPIDPIKDDFSPDPIPTDLPFDPYQEMQVYEGKKLYATQRPLVELGRPWYQLGQLSPGYSWFGKHNNVAPQFLIYGDVRTAIGSSTQLGDNVSELAYEVNLDFDLKLTSTERFHMFMSPLDNGVQNTRWLLDEGEFVDVYDANIDFGYFEGDLGAMVGGFINKTLPFDLPFAMGVMPLVLQNGVWMEDAFLGVAATIPARNSRKFNISNMDVTFFAGYDKINSDAFVNDDSAARMYGVASFIDAMNGYFEIDYAFLEDRTDDDRSYHNIGFGFTRRFGRLFSHSSRIIINAGQSTDVVENTADGVLLLSENSLITGAPSTLVPYMNFFTGFDRPQSAARAVQAGGILRNTGILFETDGMTNFPTLDPTANDTYGGAIGLNLLASDFSQQLIVELAALGVMGEPTNRNAPGGQYAIGFRYQLPLTNAIIFRTDGMYGFLEDSQDVRGLRFELRHKY